MIILDTDVAIDILHTFNQKHYNARQENPGIYSGDERRGMF